MSKVDEIFRQIRDRFTEYGKSEANAYEPTGYPIEWETEFKQALYELFKSKARVDYVDYMANPDRPKHKRVVPLSVIAELLGVDDE